MNKRKKIVVTLIVYLMFLLQYYFSGYKIFMLFGLLEAPELTLVIRLITTVSIILSGVFGFLIFRHQTIQYNGEYKFKLLLLVLLVVVVIEFGTVQLVFIILNQHAYIFRGHSLFNGYCLFSFLFGRLLAYFAYKNRKANKYKLK